MNVIFHAPAVGHTSVPLGLDGPGEATWNASGISLKGLRHSPNVGSLFGLLGFVLGVAAAALLGVLESMLDLGLTGRARAILPTMAFFGTIFGTVRVGRKMVKPKEVSFTIPWEKVKKLGVDGSTGFIAFVSKGEFKGQVQLSTQSRPMAEVLEELKKLAAQAS